jgi:hypothetical protein
MDPTTLATLLAQLLPLGIQLYQAIEQQYSGQVPPLETILAQSDVNWDAISAAANKELGKTGGA